MRSTSTNNPASELKRALVERVPLGPATESRAWRGRFSTRIEGRPVAHAGIEVAWIRQGRADYRLEGGAPFTVNAGELVVVPADTEHATAFASGDLTAGALELSSDTARAIAETVGDAQALRRGLVVESGEVRAIVDALDDEMARPGAGRALAVEALAEALLVRLLRVAPRSSRGSERTSLGRPRDPRIKNAVDFLETHASEAIDVNDLARAAGMSRFHFSRVFRDETGASPYAYLVERRLERAAARLRGGNVSVTTAALDAGFRDLGRFARAFKHRFGMTASLYAAAQGSGRVTASTHPSSRRMRASS